MAANNAIGDVSRFCNGLPADATLEDKKAFANYCLSNYQVQNWHGNSLSEYFADDFCEFTMDDFAAINSDTRRNLRDLLRNRGVYVPKGRNIVIAQALFQVVQDDLPWPDEDPEKPRSKPPAVSSYAQNLRQKLGHSQTDSADKNPAQDEEIKSKRENTDSRSNRRGIMANLFKAYSNDEDKYSGSTTDNFERKYMLFLERCDQADIPDDDRHRAFSIMLIDSARQYYFDSLKSKNLDLPSLELAMKTRFFTPERTRALLRQWELVTLSSVMTTHSSKSPSECLEILIKKLSDIQTSLPNEYRNETILRNKLLNAVRDVESCRLAYHKPADTIQGVISDLHASLATMEKSRDSSSGPSAHFYDRRYVNNNENKKRGETSRQKRCFVCKRPGCWSSNHSSKERLKTYRNSKVLRQFVATLSEDDVSDPEDRETADVLDDVIAHIIEIGQDDQRESSTESNELFSHIATIDDEDEAASFTAQLSDTIVTHALTSQIPRTRFGKRFEGIMVDTGAARGSSAGRIQFEAYCAVIRSEVQIDETRAATCHFGIGSATSLGVATISFPIGPLWLSFVAHIVDVDTPILMSIDDMDHLGIYLNNLKNVVVHSTSGLEAPVTRTHGHPFIKWNTFTSCFLTATELRRLHRRFGHPSTEKLMNVLNRAGTEEIGSDTRRILAEIERTCVACQTYAQKPRRFKFTLRDDKNFNHTIYADIFYINSAPILHVVDEATYFQSARWLDNMKAETLWKALRMCWIDIYLGPPDIIAHDAGKNFMAAAFQSNCDMLHIRTKSIPVETANSMSIVERYHTPIRRAYNIICQEAPDLDKETALQMSVKAINDSVGPDGLVPTLLVFGALPRLGLPSDPPTPSTFKRAVALRKATAAMSKHFASRQVRDATKTRNGPNVTDIHNTPIGAPVLVYRPEKDKWEGPYSLLEINGEDVLVLMSSGPTKFRSTVVKPFLTSSVTNDNTDTAPPSNITTVHLMTISPDYENDHETSTFKTDVKEVPNNNQRFEISRNIEFNDLVERGVFRPVPESDAKGSRIYGSRFVDKIKNAGKPSAYEKSRLVVQAYNDSSHGLLTYAPTVQRVSQRLLLTLCALSSDLTFFTRDISQAYVQSETSTQRPIFVRPPPMLKLPDHTLLRVERPLYGIPEAGLHWFRTYHNHHRITLKLQAATHDTCFLFTPKVLSLDSSLPKVSKGFTCLQTDDTASAGNQQFIKTEASASKTFDCKPAIYLRDGEKINFNGADIHVNKNIYSIRQPEQISKLSTISESTVNKSEFVAQRARGAYISAVCRPDLTFEFAHSSQIVNPSTNSAKILNKWILKAQSSPNFGLKFVPLELHSLRLMVFSDASFATNDDLSSQLGFVICLADKNNWANILHYTSVKSKRVTRSVLSAELFAAVMAFDYSSTLRFTLNEIFGRFIPLSLCIDSKSLYECLVGLNSTSEKRLLIDLCMLRQSYELRELNEVTWIPSEQNPADAMTKSNACDALEKLMRSNKLNLKANAWVERPEHQPGIGAVQKV